MVLRRQINEIGKFAKDLPILALSLFLHVSRVSRSETNSSQDLFEALVLDLGGFHGRWFQLNIVNQGSFFDPFTQFFVKESINLVLGARLSFSCVGETRFWRLGFWR